MTRAVSILRVADPSGWDVLRAILPLDQHVESYLDPCSAIVLPSLERQLKTLRSAGAAVLVRYAKRSQAQVEAAQQDVSERVDRLSRPARDILHHAQRHARDGVVRGSHVWDPETDSPQIRALLGAGLLSALPFEGPLRQGPYMLHPDLLAPPDIDYDFEEAVMERTDDLPDPSAGTVDLLHDLASLAAALTHHTPRRTLAGSLDKATTKRLGRHLGSAEVAKTGNLAADARWQHALDALQALGALTTEPIERTLSVEPDLETQLMGSTPEAVERMVRRLVDGDLQAAIPPVRRALQQAGDGAIDEVIFFDELAAQHREVIFARWHRHGAAVYPNPREDQWIPFDREHFDLIEVDMLHALLSRLARIGLISRADGIFAATPDGRLWADGQEPAAPPIWVSSDMSVLIPPRAITPWERYQIERLGRCLTRDVVDRYILERRSLETWLAGHELTEALDLLARRCPGLPPSVSDTLSSWARSAERFVLTRGVLVDS